MRQIMICIVAAISVAMLAPPAQAAWTCTAPTLVRASYDGGSSAYVQLQGFSEGGNYPVVRKGKTATGTTRNGTKFTCREK